VEDTRVTMICEQSLPRTVSFRRMAKTVGALAVLLAVTGGCGAGASRSRQPDVAPQPEPREDLLSAYSGKVYRVQELLQAQLQPGTYVVDAYVISELLCEPCPPDAECEQCLGKAFNRTGRGARLPIPRYPI